MRGTPGVWGGLLVATDYSITVFLESESASSKSHSQIGLDSNRAAPCHQEGNDGLRQSPHLITAKFN